ncbi:MAG: hypothetical protein JW750_11095 [Anaerolineaceae bacterium]|nr:hypothetical protein [Anaerolineaceae bacterium]
MMKKTVLWITILFCLLLLPFTVVAAEANTFRISLHRDFGYGGFGIDIQGKFSLRIDEAPELQQVTYLMDGEEMAVLTESPFRFNFSTDDYAPGIHTLSAVAVAQDGTILESNEIRADFLTKEESNQMMVKVIGAIVGGLVVFTGLSVLITTLLTRKNGKLGNQGYEDELPVGYRFRGGGICRHCGKPFSFHMWGANLLTHKFDRCPHCGKWSMLRHASEMDLKEAFRKMKAADDEKVNTINQLNHAGSESSLKDQLDQSKYLDS